MFRTVCLYCWGCLRRAIRGSLGSALNWAGILGVGAVGGYLEYRGSKMSDPHTALGVAEWAAIYTAAAWVIIFTARLFIVAPFQMWREQKDRADALEGLRQVANEASRPPSFDIGFEYTPFDPQSERDGFDSLICRSLLRIWVENVDHHPIEDCRIVIENFGPKSPIRSGALLLEDSRGSTEEKNARFHMAATEKRFFKFIDCQVFRGEAPDTRLEKYGFVRPGHPTTYHFHLRSDQDKGYYNLLSGAELEVGKQYFATIVVHGKKANSRRMDLTIKTMSDAKLQVAEADSTMAFRRSMEHERQKN